MNDPISTSKHHEEWAQAATELRQAEVQAVKANVLYAALTLGQNHLGMSDKDPWTAEQRAALLEKYYKTAISI